MNYDPIVIALSASLIVGALMATIAYLITSAKSKKTVFEIKETLSVTHSEKAQLELQLTAAIKLEKELSEQIRILELAKQKAETSLESTETTRSTLQKELAQVKDELQQSVSNMHAADKASESAKTELRETTKQLNEHKEHLISATEKHNQLQDRYENLSKEYTRLKTEQDEREASHAREVTSFEKQKESLSEQFKVLSNEILEAKTKTLQESSKLTLSSVMNPFQQTIDSFKKEVQEIHHRESTQQGELKKELETLKELNQKITTEAHELSTALRGQKKLQGNWGELVLENVLDRSGLQLGKDYKREVSITTEEGRQRPDAVVYLPQDKHLIIDAKVSLNAYTDFINAEDEAERAVALDKHVKAMGDRIKELADRDYYKLPGLNSPEMVFMFVPIESAFVEALKADETLFQSAIENNVLVATPTTLLTSLNIVRQLWRYEDQNKHTAALAAKAESVFKKLNTFLSNFENIKKSLDKAVDAYGKAEGQLVSGRGNLVKQVGEFKNLAPAIKAELPAYFTEKAALEIDFIPAEPHDQSAEPISEQITEVPVEGPEKVPAKD